MNAISQNTSAILKQFAKTPSDPTSVYVSRVTTVMAKPVKVSLLPHLTKLTFNFI
jgi:hypothetical protein